MKPCSIKLYGILFSIPQFALGARQKDKRLQKAFCGYHERNPITAHFLLLGDKRQFAVQSS